MTFGPVTLDGDKRQALSRSLALASLSLGGESRVGVLSNFLVEDGSLYAYNLISFVKVPTSIPVEGIIPGKQLAAFIKHSEHGELVLEPTDKAVELKTGKSKIELVVEDGEDFPRPPDLSSAKVAMRMPASSVRLLTKSMRYVNKNAETGWQSTIVIRPGDPIQAFSTSGINLLRLDLPGSTKATDDFFLPGSIARHAVMMARSVDEDTEVQFLRGKSASGVSWVAVRIPKVGMAAASVDESWKAGDFERIINVFRDGQANIELDDAFVQFMVKATVATRRMGSTYCLISFDGGGKVAVSTDLVGGKAVYEDDTSYVGGDPIEVKMNPELIRANLPSHETMIIDSRGVGLFGNGSVFLAAAYG